jgi:hypothetical protein
VADNGNPDAYLTGMDTPIRKKPRKTAISSRISWGISWGTVALIAPMLAILVAAGWLAARTWLAAAAAPMPASAYVALTLGVVFSLVIGCGLMALLFYSSRHGYDDNTFVDGSPPDNDRG